MGAEIHSAVGWSVTLSEIRRRHSCRRITKTNSSRKLIVGTKRKSTAPIPDAWLRKNVFHVWPDPGRRLAMYLATVD